MPNVTVTVEQLDQTASRGIARTHSVVMDRPEEKGGRNQGPLGGETMLLALGGCFLSNLYAAAKARDIGISQARAEITGVLSDAPQRYTDINMKVTASCSAPDQFGKLVTISERACIVSNTLSKAVNLTVECG